MNYKWMAVEDLLALREAIDYELFSRTWEHNISNDGFRDLVLSSFENRDDLPKWVNLHVYIKLCDAHRCTIEHDNEARNVEDWTIDMPYIIEQAETLVKRNKHCIFDDKEYKIWYVAKLLAYLRISHATDYINMNDFVLDE